jgi:hypothetical protein
VDRWRRLLEYARWAPSPHNIQPWQLRPVDDREAELRYVPDRLLPDTDPSGVFGVCGLGIFVEHLAIAARAEQLDLEVDYDGAPLDPRAVGSRPLARLRLVEQPTDEPLSRELLPRSRYEPASRDGRSFEPREPLSREPLSPSRG